ncbi:MAG: ribonuclease HII [Flavobacteriaceae bacterium]|nr:ribonuclease HII [Flavobacteriaceae bacterium]|tara:strand:+ start:8867 stop:9460 length:594 start_codon:yes stop_codon:yes gene_type:complete
MQTQLTQTLECGTDEAGRGCLAGPVTAAAVILPAFYTHPLLNDSKKLTSKQRHVIRDEIKNVALAYGIAHVSSQRIDEINILNASIEAMHRAIASMKCVPETIIVDGNKFKPYQDIPHHCIIGGDGKYLNIAAASILAKTTRDDLMLEYHQKHPHYGWDTNKGYPTTKHRNGIRTHGAVDIHRKTFTLLPKQLSLDL